MEFKKMIKISSQKRCYRDKCRYKNSIYCRECYGNQKHFFVDRLTRTVADCIKKLNYIDISASHMNYTMSHVHRFLKKPAYLSFPFFANNKYLLGMSGIISNSQHFHRFCCISKVYEQ